MRHHLLFTVALFLVISGCTPEADRPHESAEHEAHAVLQQSVQLDDDGPDHHVLYTPGDVEWRSAPASLEAGAQVAILEGDPSEAQVFTMRIRMPDGFHIAPHWHPNVERVTVVSGTFLLGDGDEVDRANVTRLGPGSYTAMPPGMRHYAIAEGETVIQLTSVGPWVINYVHSKDDPRLRE